MEVETDHQESWNSEFDEEMKDLISFEISMKQS